MVAQRNTSGCQNNNYNNFWYATSLALTTLSGAAIGYLIRRKRGQDGRFCLPFALRQTAYTKELRLAIRLAWIAGQNMIPHADSKGTAAGSHMEELLEICAKSNKNDFATAIDRKNEDYIIKEILKSFPNDRIIGEEMIGVGAIPKLTLNKTWILDPIDGTTNFANGLPLTCVSIGLCHGGQPVMGCIYAPVTQEMYVAVQGHGAYRNGVQIYASSPKNCTEQPILLEDSIVVFEWGNSARDANSVHKILYVASKILEHGVKASRQFGSGVLDLCYVASGRVNLVYAGILNEGWKPWDYCAGMVVAQEAGAVIQSIFGRPGMEGSTDEFDLVTGSVLRNSPNFDIYSKSIICGTTADLVSECRNVILSAVSASELAEPKM